MGSQPGRSLAALLRHHHGPMTTQPRPGGGKGRAQRFRRSSPGRYRTRRVCSSMSDRRRRVAPRGATRRHRTRPARAGARAVLRVRSSGLRRRSSGVPAVRLPGPPAEGGRWSWACASRACLSGLSARRIARQLRAEPGPCFYVTAACSLACSALSWRASAFSLALDPLTPPWRSARRVTGFPAATSLRATKDA
jgi:hypothetical protein